MYIVYPCFTVLCSPVQIVSLRWDIPCPRSPTKMSKCFHSFRSEIRGPDPRKKQYKNVHSFIKKCFEKTRTTIKEITRRVQS
jgi:hypothetical protein